MENDIIPTINFELSTPSDVICEIIKSIASLENTKMNTQVEYAKIQSTLQIYNQYLTAYDQKFQRNVNDKERQLERLHKELEKCISEIKSNDDKDTRELWKQCFQTTMDAIVKIGCTSSIEDLKIPWQQ